MLHPTLQALDTSAMTSTTRKNEITQMRIQKPTLTNHRWNTGYGALRLLLFRLRVGPWLYPLRYLIRALRDGIEYVGRRPTSRRLFSVVALLLAGFCVCPAALFGGSDFKMSVYVPGNTLGTAVFQSNPTAVVNNVEQANAAYVDLQIFNYQNASITMTGTVPVSGYWALPSGNNGYITPNTSTTTQLNWGLQPSTATAFTATIPAGQSVTIRKYVTVTLYCTRAQASSPGSGNPSFLYIPSNWTGFEENSLTGTPFYGTYTIGSVTKNYTFDLPLKVTGVAAFPGAYSSRIDAKPVLVLIIGGPPAVAAESGKAKFVLQVRGKQASGNKISLTLLADTRRGLILSRNDVATSAGSGTDGDIAQYAFSAENPSGYANDRDFKWEITSADGKNIIAQGFGHSPKWDGKTISGPDGTNVQPDYSFIVNTNISVVGRQQGATVPASVARGYDPNTSSNVNSPTKHDNYDSTAKALSDVLSKSGTLPDANGADQSGQIDSGRKDGDGYGDAVGNGFTPTTGTGSNNTGSSRTYQLSSIATLDWNVLGSSMTGMLRGSTLGLLGVMCFIQAIKIWRGAVAQ